MIQALMKSEILKEGMIGNKEIVLCQLTEDPERNGTILILGLF
jgi:hypothetical protein